MTNGTWFGIGATLTALAVATQAWPAVVAGSAIALWSIADHVAETIAWGVRHNVTVEIRAGSGYKAEPSREKPPGFKDDEPASEPQADER